MTAPAQRGTEPPEPVTRFLDTLRAHLAQGSQLKLVLSAYHGPETDLKKLDIRPVALKAGPCLCFVFHHTTRDITKNFPIAEGLAELAGRLGKEYRAAHLLTPTEDFHLEFSRKGAARLTRGAAAQPPAPASQHNREKRRLLDHRQPFLHALGITDAAQLVKPSMTHKWKQINKFLEIFDHALAESPIAQQPALDIVDFGCGKGYLTFALHAYLRHTLKRTANVTGVELRPELVQLCNAVAEREKCAGLTFRQGGLADYAPPKLDILMALHACDTATDLALYLGIRAGASLILCAPCCHKEIRPQLVAPPVLQPVLQHGIHAAQAAEILTDGLRALLLEASGYQVKVFEFISLEHTDKNKMLLGIKHNQNPARAAELWQQVSALKAYFGIREQRLETLLNVPGSNAGS
jgi:SAM-dependent methyltransferase